MPTVPRLDSPQVQQSAGPQGLGQITAQASAESFGGGKALDPILSAGQQLYQKAKEHADQIAVLDADKQMTELQTKLLYDPTTGALNQKGKDAFGAIEKTNTDFQSAVNDIESTLSNDQQKQAFRQRFQAAQTQIGRQLNEHASTEMQRYDASETQALIQNKRNLAIASPNNQSVINDSIIDQQTTIQQHAERNGWSPDQTKAAIDEAKSQTNLAVMGQMLAQGDDQSAAAYFEQHKGSLVGSDLTNATKIVEEGNSLGKAMRRADDNLQKGMSLTAMLQDAKTIQSPKERQAYESRVHQLDTQRKQAEADGQEKAGIAMMNFIDKGGTWQQWQMANPTQWSLLKKEVRNIGMNYRPGEEVQTDYGRWTDLMMMAATDTENFNKIDPITTRSFLDNSKYAQIVELSAKSRSGKKAEALDGFMSDLQIVNAGLDNIGVKTGGMLQSQDDKKKANAFREQVDIQKLAWQQANGKKANNDVIRKIVTDLSREVVTSKSNHWWTWDTKKHVFEVGDEDKPQFQVNDIPKSDLPQIDAALDYLGKAKNDANRLELFVRKINKNTGKKFSAN